MIFYSVDRLESGFAVLVDDEERELSVPAQQLGAGVGEGDVVFWSDGLYRRDDSETAARKARFLALFHKAGE